MNNRSPRIKRLAFAAALATAAAPVLLVAPANAAPTHHGPGPGGEAGLHHIGTHKLAPRTHFTMEPDGSSGTTVGGEGIPNIDSVKSTIRTYYNASSAGIANKDHSPYISEMGHLLKKEGNRLKKLYRQAKQDGKKPAIVFDADDTTLWTYDMEDGAMHFNFDPDVQNDDWVQPERFPATPAMPAFVEKAQQLGFTIFGITGRGYNQKDATVGNLAKYYGDAFAKSRFYTKWADGAQPSYIHCATTKCTTVEFKAGTRQHIEDLGYDIALNVGDQWSDLQGGAADHYLKLPNPTYYLPSPDLPGMNEPQLAPRTHFTMKPDGSSGKTVGGEGIPNIDSVKSTIRTYYNAGSDGIADKDQSPYISQMQQITATVSPLLNQACAAGVRKGVNPAIVLDADDTTLWTYDMEDGAMHFNFDPVKQNDDWVQKESFPATPGMVELVNAAHDAGCTLIGLTGRGWNQKTPTLGNLAKVGYDGFTADNYYTKWATGEQPSYIHCKTDKCTTIEYKSQTRKHVESAAGGHYTVLANFGDQFSDLIGGHALADVKLPNPTYYLP